MELRIHKQYIITCCIQAASCGVKVKTSTLQNVYRFGQYTLELVNVHYWFGAMLVLVNVHYWFQCYAGVGEHVLLVLCYAGVGECTLLVRCYAGVGECTLLVVCPTSGVWVVISTMKTNFIAAYVCLHHGKSGVSRVYGACIHHIQSSGCFSQMANLSPSKRLILIKLDTYHPREGLNQGTGYSLALSCNTVVCSL